MHAPVVCRNFRTTTPSFPNLRIWQDLARFGKQEKSEKPINLRPHSFGGLGSFSYLCSALVPQRVRGIDLNCLGKAAFGVASVSRWCESNLTHKAREHRCSGSRLVSRQPARLPTALQRWGAFFVLSIRPFS